MPPNPKKKDISLPLSILLTSLLALYFELKYFFDQPVGTVIGKYIPCTTKPENMLPKHRIKQESASKSSIEECLK